MTITMTIMKKWFLPGRLLEAISPAGRKRPGMNCISRPNAKLRVIEANADTLIKTVGKRPVSWVDDIGFADYAFRECRKIIRASDKFLAYYNISGWHKKKVIAILKSIQAIADAIEANRKKLGLASFRLLDMSNETDTQ